jgi:hypothetical protein
MQVVVGIHEADIARVEVAQSAHISVDTVRGRAIDGEVVKVGRVAAQNRRRWSDQSKRFSVDIGIQGDIKDLGLKPGLTAKVEILVDELKGVLAVPTQCVFAESGRFYLFKRTATGSERVQVTIEDGNASHVVVTSGIAAGDDVLLYNPERSESGSPAAQPGAASESAGDPGKP